MRMLLLPHNGHFGGELQTDASPLQRYAQFLILQSIAITIFESKIAPTLKRRNFVVFSLILKKELVRSDNS